MKITQALCVAALVATEAEAAPGSYHRKVVRETRQRLEHTYGTGLLGLFNEHGSITPATLAKDAVHHERHAGRKLINRRMVPAKTRRVKQD